MRNNHSLATFATLLLFAGPVAVAGQAGPPPPMERPRSEHLRQGSNKRLVRLLKDFQKMDEGYDLNNVQQVIGTLQAQEGLAEVKPELARTLVGWLKAYRRAGGFYEVDASRALIDLGDMEEIEAAMVKLHSPKWQERFEAIRCIGSTIQPLVIRALEKDLFTEDELRTVCIQGEFFFDAPSEFATNLITKVLVASPAFTDDVKNWAKDLASLKTRKHRELIRLWWKDNKQFFDTMSYGRVTPLSPEKYTLTPEDYQPKRGPIQRVQ